MAKKAADVRITLLGKRWNLRFVPLVKNDGDCDSPNTPGKEIRIDNRLSGERLLEILIHECRHAADWSRDEEFIAQEAKDMARVLWKLGYRREE